MANILDFLSAKTEDYEKRNLSGEKYINEGYSNRIRLREESYANTVANVLDKFSTPVSYTEVNSSFGGEEVKASAPIEVNSDISYSLKSVNTNDYEEIGLSKAIMLNEEKAKNLANNVGLDDMVKSSDLAKFEEGRDLNMDNMRENNMVDFNNNQNDFVNSANLEKKSGSSEKAIASSEFYEEYQKIMRATDETMKAKDDAYRAKTDVMKVEEEVKQKLEKSERELLSKSAEQAELQARKEAAEARQKELELSIAHALSHQNSSLIRAKKKYTEEKVNAELKIQELYVKAEKQTRENDEKITEVQRTIDRDRSDLTQVENEIAKKEAILESLNKTAEFNFVADDGNSIVHYLDDQEYSYKKSA